jgi:hypothetical protein
MREQGMLLRLRKSLRMIEAKHLEWIPLLIIVGDVWKRRTVQRPTFSENFCKHY